MLNEIEILKGLHPGIVLERELKKRGLPKGKFALSINEYPQTLSAITHGHRAMNIPLALKIESSLGLEEGYFMMLQIFYDIKEEKRKANNSQTPELSKLRPMLFWDTDINKIDWQRQKNAVLKRIMERGTQDEIAEIKRFYSVQ